MERLNTWLTAHRARALWWTTAGRAQLTGYDIGGALVVVMRWPDGEGWDIYTSHAGLRIDDTLRDVEQRIGLTRGA
jgi:hypothetical protein